MASSLLVEPACRRCRIEVAHVFRLVDCVSGQVDPDVLSPDVSVTRRTDEVPNQPTSSKGRRARRALGVPRRGHLRVRGVVRLEAFGQERLRLPLAGVPGREKAGCLVQVLVREGDDFQSSHRRTLAEMDERRRSA